MGTRGVSPVVATTILIALAVIAGVSLYYWSMSYSPRPTTPTQPVKISVRPVNQTFIKIANLGMSALSISNLTLSNGAKLKCLSNTLEPGDVVLCQIENTTIGEVALIIPGAISQSIIVNTGDIDPPSIFDIQDNWSHDIVGDTINVQATISDNFAVKNATLFYRNSGGTWQNTSMTRISGTSRFGVWSANFTPDSVGNWEYYIIAEDTSNNTRQSQVVTRYISVVKFIAPTPADGSTLGTNNFTINLTLAGTPEQINLSFNGTNFTIYGGDEIYYLKFDENGFIAEDVWGNNWSVGDKEVYVKSVMGEVPISTTDPLVGWYGQNLSRGDFDWCGGTGGSIYYAKSEILSPTVGANYTLLYNGTENWNLTNATNIYFDIKFNVSSSNFTDVEVCLIDNTGKKACHRDTGTFSAGAVRHEWYGLYTSPIAGTTWFVTDSGFNWSNVTAFELKVTSNTTRPFEMQLAPVRYAFPTNSRTQGIWGQAINVTEGKQITAQQNWCWTGTVTLLKPGKTTVSNRTFTVTAWIRSTNNNTYTYGVLSLLGDQYWCDGFDIMKIGSELRYRIGYAPCTTVHYKNNTYIYSSWNNFTDGNWHMIGLSLNDTNMSVYEDGKLINTTQTPQEMYKNANWGFVGANGASIEWSGQPFWGDIDEYHLYNYTLSPKQVELLYHMEYGPYYAKMHNLRAGKYTFKVNAKTSLGEGVTEERSVTIV